MPAQHGRDGTQHLTGPVTGFVVQDDSLPAVYVRQRRVAEEIAARYPAIDVTILFGGAARIPLLGDANLILDAAGIVEATRILGVSTVIPVRSTAGLISTEGIADVRAAFTAAGLADLLLAPKPRQCP